MDPFVFPVGVLILAVLAGSIFLHFVPVGLWISALAADVNISCLLYTSDAADE